MNLFDLRVFQTGASAALAPCNGWLPSPLPERQTEGSLCGAARLSLPSFTLSYEMPNRISLWFCVGQVLQSSYLAQHYHSAENTTLWTCWNTYHISAPTQDHWSWEWLRMFSSCAMCKEGIQVGTHTRPFTIKVAVDILFSPTSFNNFLRFIQRSFNELATNPGLSERTSRPYCWRYMYVRATAYS